MILTVGTFPHNEKMFASQVGHHFDLGKPDTIFPQKYEFVKPTTCATLVELRKFASKCVALQMEEIDLGFLTGMILNFKLKQLLPNDAEVESCRSEVVQEYNNYLNMKLGTNEGCVKFANVFLLFSDLNVRIT
uniref:Uncharacterized protein n=1 Tax=Panagrolaimus sp. JU765 TaxID=591449 RepID=A0AC34PY71_9BILA